MRSLWLKLSFFLLAVFLDSYGAAYTLCVFSKQDNVKYKRINSIEEENRHIHSIADHNVDSNSTEHCNKDSDACYALWQEDPLNKSIIILTQGCWDKSGGEDCNFSECIANKKPPKALNHTKFCCCSGNFCNINVTDGYVNQDEDLNPALQYVKPIAYSTQTVVIIAFVALAVFTVIMLVTYFMFQVYYNSPKRSNESLHLVEAAPPPAPTFDIDSLKIQETVGRGRYGSVCRATLHDHTVAVKIFSHQNKQYFLNERDIYMLPHMDHPSLLKYIGSDERMGAEGRPEYLLIMTYSPIGCLQDFLKNNTIDWARLCKMALSIARGLAHLHAEFGKGDKFKPCVAHRDLTSRNILMKNDGSCTLCDFGFAIRIAGSKYYQNGEQQVAETTSLADVGTLRYMAPEILEGALNLRDCESSLKQIDVYALGLVIWEIATKCSDLFQGVEVPEYKLPFEAEIGTRPTMEQMQVLVARHKARPLFPDIWKDTNLAVRALKETIEECWDQDAEARLTILCIEERLFELPVLWERHKAGLSVPSGVSPTINPTSNQKTSLTTQINNNQGDNLNPTETLNNGDIQPSQKEEECSLSEGTTETLLSPTEPGTQSVTPVGNNKNSITNNATSSSKVSVPLQPHQGRNPCLERNLMLEPLDELAVSGNTLLERGTTKVTIDRNFRSFSDGDTDVFDVPILDNSSLVSSDLLNHSMRVCNPIPYLQNAVHSTSNIPKQPNVPGNGHSLRERDSSKFKDDRSWGPLNFFDRRRRAREGLRAGLRNLLERKSTSTNNTELSEEQQPLKGSPGSCYSPVTPGSVDSKLGKTNPVNFYWACEDAGKESDHLIDTEVRVVKSDHCSTIVRPLNNAHLSSGDKKEESIKPIEKNIVNGHATISKTVANDIKCETDTHPKTMEQETKLIEKSKRPTSLPVQKFQNDYIDNDVEVDNSDSEIPKEALQNDRDNHPAVLMRRKGSNGKRKGVKRVKTPFEIKGRFSLYDDRIMSSQDLPVANSKAGAQCVLGGTTKFSASVPLDMNTLCSSQSSNSVHVDQTDSVKLQHVCKSKPLNGLKLPVYHDQQQIVHSLFDI